MLNNRKYGDLGQFISIFLKVYVKANRPKKYHRQFSCKLYFHPTPHIFESDFILFTHHDQTYFLTYFYSHQSSKMETYLNFFRSLPNVHSFDGCQITNFQCKAIQLYNQLTIHH